MKNRLSYEEAVEIAASLRNSLKIQNEIGFGDMNIVAPDIDFFKDGDLYYNSYSNEIHLGIYGIVDIFDISDEVDFVNATNYGRGHEEQHCRSTASIPYAWGITRGIETILEYISAKEEKSKRRFRNQADYMDFANRVLPGMGIYISYQMLQSIVGGLANSIEDGRIERIRANRFPGFEKLRMIYRGRFWETQSRDYKKWEEIKGNAAEQLYVLLDQILSLATCQLYTKGFIKTYAGTPMVSEVKALLPHIAKGVMAGKTRAMAFELIEITKLLAPYIYETCKLSERDIQMRKTLEQAMADMVKSMVDQMPETGLSEKDEDTDEGGANSTFPRSDLVVTLDDETYDKLMEKSKESSDGGGIMIQREHPKEEENKEKEEGSENASNDSSSKEDTSKTSSNSEKSSKSNQDAANAEECDEVLESGDLVGEAESSSSKAQRNKRTRGSKNAASGNADPNGLVDEDAIRSCMKEAAESMNEAAKKEIDNINTHAVYEKRTQGKEVLDTSKTITAEDVKDVCPSFREFKREYKLTEKLPPVLASRGRTLLRKNQRYFKSLSTPNVSFLDSGMVDPSRIYGLAFGDTEIFRKKGIDKKFDGCVYILLDNSGSMSGMKRIEACKAAAVIEESFRGLIPIKIVAFDYGGTVIHEVIKGWDEQMRLNCCWNFYLHGRQGGGNADGYDIKIATKELLARPEQKKLLIVLSDGMPAEATPGFTKGAIEAARKSGIQVTGIYFEEGSYIQDAGQFKAMYEGRGANANDAICCSLNQLDSNLQAVMKRFSRR